jgi:alginate O-acetyltransferase complex protein AlgI
VLFNSTAFFIFLGAFLLGWFAVRRSLRARAVLILLGSYIFYAWWYYPYLALLVGVSLASFIAGRILERTKAPAARRAVLTAGIAVCLAPLLLFKYSGFLRDSLAALLASLGLETSLGRWEWLLPVGISFYTFQAISYLVDVYRRDLSATRNLVSYLGYIAFFPQLVAGPIERASHLLPQMERPLVIRAAAIESGLWLILWGLFKKVVIADNAAPLVELVFGHRAPGAPLILLGTAAFALQIYGDFSGYTDIARGGRPAAGLRVDGQLQSPLFRHQPAGFLGPLAYQPVHLAA